MLAYLVNFIHAFIPLSLVTGMLIVLVTPAGGKKPFRSLLIAIVCGVLAGCVIQPLALRHEMATAARSALHGVALVAALLTAVLIAFSANRQRGWQAFAHGAALFFSATLATASAWTFSVFIAEKAITTSSVLNTEVILNVGGILAGLALTSFLIPLTAHMSARNGRRAVTGILLFVSALLVSRWAADLLLGMMRLEMIELTSTRVSIVAKIGKYSALFSYLNLLLLALLSLTHFLRRPKVSAAELSGMEPAERRKKCNVVLLELRWFRGALASFLLALALLLYHDLYASRPPRITKPVNMTPDAGGTIKVKIEELGDGNLHRYSYVTDDGHVVRFFMINRSGGKKIGVVYDACMLCGDMGYLQDKNEVICIACNVRIFIPSIGKAGGCNPIPLPHHIEGGQVSVSVAELDKGAKYFSEVVTVKVKDPVTGREMISRDAPQRDEYKGRTYFFESAESLERFRASPEKYIGEKESRYYRTQGFQGA
ncbi:MAG: Fe-S-containing protein [Geobacteraceae bacterium]|nr:Fe-S-containing protein [Geobacteraceae bacterium]